MSDGQQEAVYEQHTEQWQCTVCGRVGTVGRCCGRDTRVPLNEAATEAPPLAYQATGGAGWQSERGWGYQPLNHAAMAHRLRRLASDLQQAANALAAIGMGRGRYPEWSEELASLSRRMPKWAGEVESEAAERSEPIVKGISYGTECQTTVEATIQPETSGCLGADAETGLSGLRH